MDFFGRLSKEFKINLDEQQVKAVQHIDGAALVLAGPGSGKTTVIISRLAHMVLEAGINPSSILSMAFNKAAAMEMEQRFSKVFGRHTGQKIGFSTLHSFCYSVLRSYTRTKNVNLTLIEDAKNPVNKRNILRGIYQKVNGAVINDDELESLINQVGFVKNKMIKSEEEFKCDIRNFYEIFRSYEEHKRENRLIDFDDMLTYCLSILKKDAGVLQYYRNRYRYLQIDEGQDLSNVQFEIVKLLAAGQKNLFMVADDDQSIYGFRGAEPQYIMNFKNDFEKADFYYLEKNYRSSRNIVDLSSRFIKVNLNRYDKNHKTDNLVKKDPEIVYVDDEQGQLDYVLRIIKAYKARGKNSRELSVLFRNNLSAVLMVEAFDHNGIDFRIKDSKLFFFNHWFVQDILAFFKLALDGRNEEAFQRIYYKMNRYISKNMMECVLEGDKDRPIMDRLLQYEDLKPFQRSRLAELRVEFALLLKMSAEQALKYIEDSFKYLEYAKDYCEKWGYSYENIQSLFTILKYLASAYRTIPAFLERVEGLQALIENSAGNKDCVALSTVHSAKGLEYDCVFMVDLFDGEFPNRTAIEEAKGGESKELLEEEHRLFYVGMTRAREGLHLICPKSRNDTPVQPSLFVREVESFLQGKVLDKVHHGMSIKHKVYGQGTVTSILNDTEWGRATIKVDFGQESRTLDLKVCMEKGIISF